MPKLMAKLVTLAALSMLGLAALWLMLVPGFSPAQAKEDVPTVSSQNSVNPAARVRASATFSITVSSIVASGFSAPVQVTNAGDGSNRLFVVEQAGVIRIINSPVVTPFLDIRSLVKSGGEEGLLSVAFHPNYESNGHFYVYYNSNATPDGNITIARYSVSSNPNIANPASAVIVLTIPHPGETNHNGGQLMFSPLDGYLYAGTGDGGSGNDPPNNAQNINSLLGKMLRLNVTGATTYTIPAGNPYAGATAGADEIWDLGLRNPFRYSFDRGDSNGNGKGDLYIGDVGQGAREEVSYQAATTPGGVNFGWRCKEGTLINTSNNINNLPPCNNAAFLATLTNPIAEYVNPPSGAAAVTGGYVYRGNLYPALKGYYFYADFYSGVIFSVHKIGSVFSNPEIELDTSLNISSFGEDEQGELYVVDYNGSIRRLADVNGPTSLLTASKSASRPAINPGETLTYTIFIKNTSASTPTFFMKDQIPAGLSYIPGSLVATQGSADDSLNPVLRWQGTLVSPTEVTITYRVTATGLITGLFTNQAVITSASTTPLTLTNYLFVPLPIPQYFPLIFK
ncbi:MAG: PQQ-dependent sugar dehydrogenase [Anaerolineae bacterium]